MLATRRVTYKCVVCGRAFPRGQGVVLKVRDVSLEFHSSKCASKFLRRLLESAPLEDIIKYVKETRDLFVKDLELLERKRAKKI